jgi:peptidoglycan/LPS O-acetylase OafA/YrhL
MTTRLPHAPGSALGYRPDIDGLRAMAVLSVVLFHAFPGVLPGGFIGVDIFFVISGYLITSLMMREHQATGDVRILGFYIRRTRRIFPALMLVLITSLGVAWIALTSNEFKPFGKYMAGGAVFLDNFLFWRDAGYFDTKAEVKPMLHLWSLGVEEQFYLCWPLLLAFLLKQQRRAWALPLGLCIVAASFIYALYKIQLDEVGAFYSPLTRMWELLAGGVLSILQSDGVPPRWQRIRPHARLCTPNRMAILGGLCLLAGLFLIDSHRLFPGAWALLPVTGTVLLVASGPHSALHRQLLSHPWMIRLGLISYPLYLWHWPLLSFARILDGETPPVTTRGLLVVASLGLSYLTYRFVERPVRTSRSARPGRLALVLVGVMLVLLFVGYGINRHDGLRWRHHQKLSASPDTMILGADRDRLLKTCGVAEPDKSQLGYCLSDPKSSMPNMAILGDSKAEALFYGLVRESAPDQTWMLIGKPPFLVDSPVNEIALRRVLDDPAIRVVVLTHALRSMTALEENTGRILTPPDEAQRNTWHARYSQLIQRLLAAGKLPVLVLDHPTLPDPNDCIEGAMTDIPILGALLKRKANPHCSQTYQFHLTNTAPYRAFAQRLQEAFPALLVFDLAPLVCDLTYNQCTITRQGQFLYSYGDHLSDVSNTLAARALHQAMTTQWPQLMKP